MSQLQILKSANSINDVAALLSFKPSAVAFILYKKAPGANYRAFEIAKRHGGTRVIKAPSDELKLLQKRLSDLLQNCVEEITEAQKWKDDLAHGFKRHRSIITNATKHRRRRYVLNIDLQDFFGTINFGRVRGFFIKERNFGLKPAVATILAQIACCDNALPQGSPCSPVISNLIGHVLDIQLSALAFKTGCTYSRYADDITFSTNKQVFPDVIAKRQATAPHEWEVGRELQGVILRAGFSINMAKTRMQYHTSRQDVTGLVVNAKVNVRSEYRRTVRAMAHRLFTTGHFEFIQTIPDAAGILVPTPKEGTLAQLHGMFGHIDGVDWHNRNATPQDSQPKPSSTLKSKEHLYRRFLMFKEFYKAEKPVIICEGQTDNIYIRSAIRSLADGYPILAAKEDGGAVSLHVRIFKYTQTSTGRILRLHGGTGYFTKFIPDYVQQAKKFKAAGGEQPIILLVDNDEGASSVYKVIQDITHKKPSRQDPFVHIGENLYLVPTPLKAGVAASLIEDFFPAGTKKTVIDGKTFNPAKDADMTVHYTKSVFAQKVVKEDDSIDFTGFSELLNRFAAVIAAHAKDAAADA